MSKKQDFKEREKLEDLLNYVKIEKFIKLSKIETAITNKKLVLNSPVPILLS